MLDPTYRDVKKLLGQASASAAREQERLQRWQVLQGMYEKSMTLFAENRFDESIGALQELIQRDASFPQVQARLEEITKAKEKWETEKQECLRREYNMIRDD